PARGDVWHVRTTVPPASESHVSRPTSCVEACWGPTTSVGPRRRSADEQRQETKVLPKDGEYCPPSCGGVPRLLLVQPRELVGPDDARGGGVLGEPRAPVDR